MMEFRPPKVKRENKHGKDLFVNCVSSSCSFTILPLFYNAKRMKESSLGVLIFTLFIYNAPYQYQFVVSLGRF